MERAKVNVEGRKPSLRCDIGCLGLSWGLQLVAGCRREGQWLRRVQQKGPCPTPTHDSSDEMPRTGHSGYSPAPWLHPHLENTAKSPALSGLSQVPSSPVVFISVPVSELLACLSSLLGAFISLLEIPRLLAVKGSAGPITSV